MTNSDEMRRQFEYELARVGLPLDALPGGGLVTGPEGLAPLVARLREMSPGVTWWDVLPDLPRHWEAGKPETWTTPYRPLGPYDYQTLPAGPALLIVWEAGAAEELESLVSKARSAGWPVHGSGIAVTPSERNKQFLAHIVLERGTGEDQFYDFGEWINRQPGFEVAGYTRAGNEIYLESDSST